MNRGKAIVTIISIAVAIIIIVVGIFTTFHRKDIGECSTYNCDVRAISLNTYITISKDDEEIGVISGKTIRLFTDPLTMTRGDETVAYASDAYHLISQDSHSIFVGEEMKIEMVGQVKVVGESYEIYDSDGQKIAKASFNYFNTKGSLEDLEGNLWVDYYSGMFRKDYEIRITPECPLSEEEVLLLFASYYSDQAQDHRS